MPTRASSGSTGSPLRTEWPKSPCSMLPNQAAYCPGQVRGRPCASRTPRAASGSPGARARMPNTTTLTPKSSSAVTASSRASTRLTGLTAASFTSLLLARGNEPFVGEREELVRVDLHAPHLPVERAVVGECPEESVRLLLREDRVQLAVDGAALLVVERELALDDQPVHLGVGVAAEVVLPGADLGRVEQRRDVR